MKKFFFLALLPMMCALTVFTSCSEEEGEGGASNNEVLVDFNYPESALFGTWDVVELDGEELPSGYETSFTFTSDGECVGRGPLSFNDEGEYTASGNAIKIYIYDQLFYTFSVKSMNSSSATVQATLVGGAGSWEFEMEKR